MQRLFLPWSIPVCQAVTEKLLEMGSELSHHAVLVPTRESGRKLRESLAAAAPNRALFPPRVMEAARFSQQGQQEDSATVPEELAAWISALGHDPKSHYPKLFPKTMPNDLSALLDIAGKLLSLRHNMARQGISCSHAQEACGDRDERWSDINTAMEHCTKKLNSWGLVDKSALPPQASEALLAELKESGGSIIVACVPDMPYPVRQALLQAEKQGIPVHLWIHSPVEEADTFDEWGRPIPSVWSNRTIPIKEEQIIVTADPEHLAAETCRIIAQTAENGEPDVALGVCDTDMKVSLDAALRQNGWGLYNPEGKAFAGIGIMDLLRILQQAAEEPGTARPVFNLMRSSLLCSTLGIIKHQKLCCTVLDQLQQKYIPESEAFLLELLETKHPDAVDAVKNILTWRDKMTTPGKQGVRLLEWLPELENTYGEDSEALDLLRSNLEGLARLQERTDEFDSPATALGILITALQQSRFKHRRAPHAVLDSLGWMEVHFRPEKHLILTGMNEGIVPEGSVADQFLPEDLRETLGIDSLNRKKARDSFLLTALLHSREETGSLTLILSRLSSANDPLTPSSLLLRCTDEELPQRVNHLFQEINDPPPPIHYERGNWHLKPEKGWHPAQTIQELVPDYHNLWKEQGKPFSPSCLKRFLECPMRFWIKEALNLNNNELIPNKDTMSPNEVGDMMHRVLELFCREHAAINDRMTESSLQDSIMDILNQEFREQYGSVPLMPLLLQKRSMEQRLCRFASLHLAELQQGWSCIDFEKQVDDWTLEGFPLKFRIDRIDFHEKNNTIRVIDYKTGSVDSCEKNHLKSFTNPENLSLLSPNLTPWCKKAKNGNISYSRWADLQLPIYASWARQQYNKDVTVSYYKLPANLLDVGINEWVTLKETHPDNPTTLWEHACNWAIEIMQLIHDGKGLITAEDLGWGVPKYDLFKNITPSEKESLQELLGMPTTLTPSR